MTFDLCVVSIPYIPTNLPPAAPAVLKGHLQSRGYRVTTKEYNLETKMAINDAELMSRLSNYWCEDAVVLSAQDQAVYNNVLEYLSRDLVNTNSRWYGISVFTKDSRKFCRDLLPYVVKKKSPESQILLGGHGVTEKFFEQVKHLADVAIYGEGELALENLLCGNMSYPGINCAGEQIQDLDALGPPDYSDYHRLKDYDNFYDGITVQITGSRGCVRSCSFCDVAHFWPKFKSRSGAKIAQDIIDMHAQTGIQNYFFTDSLINGNVKELMIMMQTLADYKQATGADFSWGGQWIARKQQGLPKNYYQLIKASGAHNLTIGVETGSDAVRAHMKKGFTNHDLDLEMEQFSQHGITCSFYIIIGYPTETEQDFVDTLDMFKRYIKYVADGTLVGLILGGGFQILPNTPLAKEKNKIWKIEQDNATQWTSLVTTVDYVESIRRRIMAQQVIESLKWPANNVLYELSSLLISLKSVSPQHRDSVEWQNDMFNTVSKNYQLPVDPAPMTISISLTGTCSIDWPEIDIMINSQIVAQSVVVENNQVIKVTVPGSRKRNMLSIHLKNKTEHDTVVENGVIVQDKNVVINEIVFGDVRVRHDDLYQQGFMINRTVKTKSAGLYHADSVFKFYFENPAVAFFLKSKKGFFSNHTRENQQSIDQLVDFFRKLTYP